MKSVQLSLACVVPVYNEAEILEKAITLLVSTLKRQQIDSNWQVIIASNGSTDQTDEIGRKLEKSLTPHVKLIECSQKGKGQALRQAFRQVSARRYLYIDVDLPCRLSDISVLLGTLDGGADLVTSRRIGHRPPMRKLMTSGLMLINRVLFGISITDSHCPVKALSPRAAEVIVRDTQQTSWYIDTELVVLCAARGLSQMEQPVHWVEKRFPNRESKVNIWKVSVLALYSLSQIWNHRRKLLHL